MVDFTATDYIKVRKVHKGLNSNDINNIDNAIKCGHNYVVITNPNIVNIYSNIDSLVNKYLEKYEDKNYKILVSSIERNSFSHYLNIYVLDKNMKENKKNNNLLTEIFLFISFLFLLNIIFHRTYYNQLYYGT